MHQYTKPTIQTKKRSLRQFAALQATPLLRRICLLLALSFLILRLPGSPFPDRETSVYYINLQHRHDRRESIEKVLRLADFQFERVDAVNVQSNAELISGCEEDIKSWCAGKLGCKLSHVSALQRAMRTLQSDYVMIFEDDFNWTKIVEPRRIHQIINTVQVTFPDWKVFLLSANFGSFESTGHRIQTSINFAAEVVRVFAAQTTHAYVVNAKYITALKSNFESCNVLMKNVAIDQCWKELQRVDQWYGFVPQLGIQMDGYSDILSEVKEQTWTRQGFVG